MSSKRVIDNNEFFDEIYNEYYINVFNKIRDTLYTKVDDDITSCIQDTFMKAWQNIEILKEHKNVAGWLVITAKNVAMDDMVQ